VDIAGTGIANTLVTIPCMYLLISDGVPRVNVYLVLLTDPIYLAISTVIGLSFSFIGGRVAASLAGGLGAAHGLVSALPCVLLGVLDTISPFPLPIPTWIAWGGKAAAVVCAFLGGRSAKV